MASTPEGIDVAMSKDLKPNIEAHFIILGVTYFLGLIGMEDDGKTSPDFYLGLFN